MTHKRQVTHLTSHEIKEFPLFNLQLKSSAIETKYDQSLDLDSLFSFHQQYLPLIHVHLSFHQQYVPLIHAHLQSTIFLKQNSVGSGADPGIPLRVGDFCILISNFNIYNTKKRPKAEIYCSYKQKVTNKRLIITFYN